MKIDKVQCRSVGEVNLLPLFFNNEIVDKLRDMMDDYEPQSVEADHTEFVYVDGEEGDHGVIRYYTIDSNKLIATRTIHGGDMEDFEFTEYGKSIYFNSLMTMIIEIVKGK